jgi:hypothetical protein
VDSFREVDSRPSRLDMEQSEEEVDDSAQELDEGQEAAQQVVEDNKLGLKSRSNLLKRRSTKCQITRKGNHQPLRAIEEHPWLDNQSPKTTFQSSDNTWGDTV